MQSDAESARTLSRAGAPTIAYHAQAGTRADRRPGVVFLGGFRSDMSGGKALFLEQVLRAGGQAYLRFDYSGHGISGGAFTDGCIGDWFADALAVFDQLTQGRQILVGSSMGGWIALLIARARPERVAGFVGIAAAPDFTEDLMLPKLSAEQKALIEAEGRYDMPSAYGAPTPITKKLLDDGADHLLLRAPIPFAGPVRLLQGMRDDDVPWERALMLAEKLESADVSVTLVKDGDHRLSRPQDLERLGKTVAALSHDCARAPA